MLKLVKERAQEFYEANPKKAVAIGGIVLLVVILIVFG